MGAIAAIGAIENEPLWSYYEPAKPKEVKNGLKEK